MLETLLQWGVCARRRRGRREANGLQTAACVGLERAADMDRKGSATIDKFC